MGSKIKTFAVFFLLGVSLFINSPVSAEYSNIVRVGITDNKFQNVLKQEVTIYGTSDCDICDKETKKIIAQVPAETEINIRNGVTGLDVIVNGRSATFRDFVVVCPRGVLGVKDLKRKGMPALYHGAFELVQKPDRRGFYLGKVLFRTKCL